MRDRGIGISHDVLHKLFRDFNQVDATTASRFGNTGLGLAVSQSVCRMIGGEIVVESEYGKGGCFAVTLPADPTAHTPEGRNGTSAPHATSCAGTGASTEVESVL
jgi:signal transduction histidine kinase